MEKYQIKTASDYSWEARFDEERNLYTAVCWGGGSRLYEIDETIFNELKDDIGKEGQLIISKGRKLYMDVCDRCGPPYTIVFDEDYRNLCPWAQVTASEEQWPTEMVDAVVEVLDSEKNNREQRREKRKRREEGE